jgi:diguanylate cyclase (GGDEF)-like protein
VFGYLSGSDGRAADWAGKVAVLGYASVLVPLCVLALPGGEPVDWRWFELAAASLAVGVAIGAIEQVRVRRAGGRHATEPVITLLIGLALVGGLFALNLAVAPASAVLGSMLLIPPLMIATIGNRAMFGLVSAASIAALAITITQAAPTGPLGIRLVAELAGAVTILVLVRTFATHTVAAIVRDDLFASMSEVAATTDSLDEGWERVLPLVGHYLGAERLTVGQLTDDGEGIRSLAAWPAAPDWDRADADLRAALDGARTSLGATARGPRVTIPVTSADGLRLLVVADGMDTSTMGALPREYRTERVALQLDVLVNRVRMIENLELLTRTDSLTNVHNRRSLMERLEHETKVAARSSDPLCVAIIDLDHFKAYNDDLGHLEGDRALVGVAQVLSTRLRATDLVGRYGGEEFVLVLPQTDSAGARQLLDELRFLVHELRLTRPLTFSGGVAQWDGFESVDELIGRADHALYLAKDAGRDQVRFADRSQPLPHVDGKPRRDARPRRDAAAVRR